MTRFKSNIPFIVKLTGMTDYCQKADTFVKLGYILAICQQAFLGVTVLASLLRKRVTDSCFERQLNKTFSKI